MADRWCDVLIEYPTRHVVPRRVIESCEYLGETLALVQVTRRTRTVTHVGTGFQVPFEGDDWQKGAIETIGWRARLGEWDFHSVVKKAKASNHSRGLTVCPVIWEGRAEDRPADGAEAGR